MKNQVVFWLISGDGDPQMIDIEQGMTLFDVIASYVALLSCDRRKWLKREMVDHEHRVAVQRGTKRVFCGNFDYKTCKTVPVHGDDIVTMCSMEAKRETNSQRPILSDSLGKYHDLTTNEMEERIYYYKRVIQERTDNEFEAETK